MRRPRAPTLRCSASSATVSIASSVKRNRTFSNSNSRWYCLQRVLRLRQNLHKRALVEVAHHAGNRQAAHEFRNQSITDQIARLHLLKQLRVAALCRRWRRFGMESQRALAHALLDNLLEAHERSAANKEDVRRVHRREFLVRMFPSALRRHVGHRAFQNL